MSASVSYTYTVLYRCVMLNASELAFSARRSRSTPTANAEGPGPIIGAASEVSLRRRIARHVHDLGTGPRHLLLPGHRSKAPLLPGHRSKVPSLPGHRFAALGRRHAPIQSNKAPFSCRLQLLDLTSPSSILQDTTYDSPPTTNPHFRSREHADGERREVVSPLEALLTVMPLIPSHSSWSCTAAVK